MTCWEEGWRDWWYRYIDDRWISCQRIPLLNDLLIIKRLSWSQDQESRMPERSDELQQIIIVYGIPKSRCYKEPRSMESSDRSAPLLFLQVCHACRFITHTWSEQDLTQCEFNCGEICESNWYFGRLALRPQLLFKTVPTLNFIITVHAQKKKRKSLMYSNGTARIVMSVVCYKHVTEAG